jgi:hypothetical protein
VNLSSRVHCHIVIPITHQSLVIIILSSEYEPADVRRVWRVQQPVERSQKLVLNLSIIFAFRRQAVLSTKREPHEARKKTPNFEKTFVPTDTGVRSYEQQLRSPTKGSIDRLVNHSVFECDRRTTVAAVRAARKQRRALVLRILRYGWLIRAHAFYRHELQYYV